MTRVIPPAAAVRWILAALILSGSAAVLGGCSLGYLARSAWEEGRILWRRKPISDQLARADLPADVRRQLAMVPLIRRFARERLGLNVGGAYRTISEIDGGAVVHVVMAAPRDSLKPYVWWFPIVGSVPYRGYFDAADARAEAAALDASGLDTMVRQAAAFSSLGFFDDPVLSNLLKLNRVELAAVLFHELFHRTFFMKSNVAFNESAATYIGSRAAADFFAATEGEASSDAVLARRALRSQLRFSGFLLQAEARLLRIYTSGLSQSEMLRRREEAFKTIQRDYSVLAPSLAGLARFDLATVKLNNAVLLNYLIYFHDLDNFATLDGMNHCDLKATIAEIIALAQAHPDDPFYALWQQTRQLDSRASQPCPRESKSALVNAASKPPKK